MAVIEGYGRKDADNLFKVTRGQYIANRKANARGTANPSVMNNPFWEFQIGPEGLSAWTARSVFGNGEDPLADSEEPVWCFNRFGATRTKLPDGRVVCIGGEHEDGYDPDFCIYNGMWLYAGSSSHRIQATTSCVAADSLNGLKLVDVVVFDAPRKSDPPPLLTPDCIKIYGYPVDVFPPTDFHTSTFYADPTIGKGSVFIIGGLGYADQASRNRTDVHRLDLSDFSIRRMETNGEGPVGGTSNHKAELFIENEHPVIKLTTEEVKELIPREDSEQCMMIGDGEKPTRTTTGESSVATAKNEENPAAEKDKNSSATLLEREESKTITESKVFTLRIHNMAWI